MVLIAGFLPMFFAAYAYREFNRILFDNAFNFVFKLLFPLLGGLGLFFVLIITLRDSASPDYGSGASMVGSGWYSFWASG